MQQWVPLQQTGMSVSKPIEDDGDSEQDGESGIEGGKRANG
jgi:hypothetical protein